jgi:hypothetical protein
MIHLSDAERIELRMAEMSSVCGPITLYSDDPWNPAGNSNWVQWCGKVQQYNPHFGWSHGCTSGKRIGTKIRTARGTFKAMASPLP